MGSMVGLQVLVHRSSGLWPMDAGIVVVVEMMSCLCSHVALLCCAFAFAVSVVWTEGGSVVIALILGARRVAGRFGDAEGVQEYRKKLYISLLRWQQ